MSKLNYTPHITHTKSGNNYHDPMGSAVFEVQFTLPRQLQQQFKEDEITLTEQVTTVDGLDVLQKTVAEGQQKFMGVTSTFLNPMVDDTSAKLTITFNLNIRNASDAWVLKIFKAWEKLGYDLSDGTRTLMADYVADNLRINEGNRDGTIWRSYVFHKIMITSVTGANTLDYNDNEARKLTVEFVSDWWEEDLM